MKIKALDRVLLVAAMLCFIAIALLFAAIGWRMIPINNIMYFVETLYSTFIYTIALTIAALVILIVAFKLLFLNTAPSKAEQQKKASTIIKVSDIGVASISYGALEAMVQKQARTNQRVRDCKTLLSAMQDAVSIHLAVSVLPGTNLVELIAELQQGIKENIETLTGLAIKEVSVTIESADAAEKI